MGVVEMALRNKFKGLRHGLRNVDDMEPSLDLHANFVLALFLLLVFSEFVKLHCMGTFQYARFDIVLSDS